MVGREKEIARLNQIYDSDESEFVAVYGRRRVGKTYLVREVFANRILFMHTGRANAAMKQQLAAFRASLQEQGLANCPPLGSWLEAFQELKRLINSSGALRKVLFIDELPWLDTPKSGFLSELEGFWNQWASARKDIVLVVCGSATSWIINKVLRNRGGLHNRVTAQIPLEPFTLGECERYAVSRGMAPSRAEIVEYYMVLGGIPYYWRFLDKGLSLSQNIDALFFASGAPLRLEFSELYSSLFRHEEPYVRIVSALGRRRVGLGREEISEETGLASNGRLTGLLEELEQCGFIRKYRAFGLRRREAIYQLIDNFTLFYFQFMQGNHGGDVNFWSNSINSHVRLAWEGLAFERVCLQHVRQIKAALGISGVLTEVSSWRRPPSANEGRGAQIDLVIDRADRLVNLCEMKFSGDEYAIDDAEEKRLRNRRAAFIEETGTRKGCHVTMVTTYGIKRNRHSGIIQSQVTMDQLFAN